MRCVAGFGFLTHTLHPPTLSPLSPPQPLESIDGGLWTPVSLASAEGLKRRFEAADVDGNGIIDRDELRTVLEATSGGAACTLTHWLTGERERGRRIGVCGCVL